MTTMRVAATATVLSTIMLLLPSTETRLSLGGEPEKQVGVKATIPTLRQAIESRFGRPDRIVGEENSLLQYRLENGDTLTLVLAGETLLGIEHAKKIDLNKVVGTKVTLVGVYNGLAKASDQIVMADGQWFWLQNQNKVSENGKLVSATGVLKYFPGRNGPTNVHGPPAQTPPAHYYMESDSTKLKVLYPVKFEDRKTTERSQQKKSEGSGAPFE